MLAKTKSWSRFREQMRAGAALDCAASYTRGLGDDGHRLPFCNLGNGAEGADKVRRRALAQGLATGACHAPNRTSEGRSGSVHPDHRLRTRMSQDFRLPTQTDKSGHSGKSPMTPP